MPSDSDNLKNKNHRIENFSIELSSYRKKLENIVDTIVKNVNALAKDVNASEDEEVEKLSRQTKV